MFSNTGLQGLKVVRHSLLGHWFSFRGTQPCPGALCWGRAAAQPPCQRRPGLSALPSQLGWTWSCDRAAIPAWARTEKTAEPPGRAQHGETALGWLCSSGVQCSSCAGTRRQDVCSPPRDSWGCAAGRNTQTPVLRMENLSWTHG